uniref:Antimicrobial peptide resistance and lipid A acylation protein PagP n=1 Tax=Musca domestica TaxID=7370 RepID=T1PI55_MUSDO
MTLKVFAFFLILALVFHINAAAPTSDSMATTEVAPFATKNMDEIVQYLLQTTIHKYDAKVSVVQSHIKRFQEAVEMLIGETPADDNEKITKYNELLHAIGESLNAIDRDTSTCGLYLVATAELSHIDSLVVNSKDAQLWNYWTLSDIDEKNLFVTLAYESTDVYRQEAQQYFDENPEFKTEAKSKAKQYVTEHCSKYKEYYKDEIVGN